MVSPPRTSTPSLVNRLLRRPRTGARSGSYLDSVPVRQLFSKKGVISEADVEDADAVIATWWETAEWVAKLGSRKGRKIYFVQGHEIYPWLPQARARATYKLPLHKIVVSRWLEDIMRDEYGDHHVDLVPNAVDHATFNGTARGKRPHPTVGLLYSPTPIKGLDIALAALEMVRKSLPNLQVIMFGFERPTFPLPPFIKFLENPSQAMLKTIYSECDVWVTASRSEGFNLPAMEAMACRTPVVSTRTGWPAHALIDGLNGACVNIDDTEALARATQRILVLPDNAWRHLSDHAFESVRASNWERSADLFEQALTRVVGSRP